MTNKQSVSDVTGEATPRRSYCSDCRVNPVSTYPSSVELCSFHAAVPERDQLIAQRDALVKVKARHDEYARARNFASCGCDYCEALREGA
jgi:hypothetical protein